MKLSDVGEFNLLNKLILPLLNTSKKYIGDDCAFIDFPRKSHSLVVTTDAGPRPLFHSKEYPYYYVWGWYTVLANVSDLASSGCWPLAISLAVEANSEMKVGELKDYFNGVNAASKKFGIPVSGGNIKANSQFISNGTALGYLKNNQKRFTRSHCRPEDIVISIGEHSTYIIAYLKYKKMGEAALSKRERQVLSGPFPQLGQMQILNKNLDITSSTDNSDGILGALWNIAEKSNCSFIVDMDSISLPNYIRKFAVENGINPWNLFLFWGNWQVVITLNPKHFERFENRCKKNSIAYTILGKAVKGSPALYALHEGEKKVLKLLRNENFSKLSYNHNIMNHIDYLLKEPLFKN